MKKYIDTLEREHECYYDYILESLINGQRAQVRTLFNAMCKEDKEDFLINYLDDGECKNICIEELVKNLSE